MDYQYDDGQPGAAIYPQLYFGEKVEVKDRLFREGFAEWMIDSSNPRFCMNITNRLWKHVFGIAPIEPVNNIAGRLRSPPHHLKLVEHLQKLMIRKEYRLKEFLRVLYKTETFSGIKPVEIKEKQ